MKRNQFSFSTDKVEFIQELRQKVDAYFKESGKAVYGDYRIVIKSIVMGLMYLIPYTILLVGLVESAGLSLILWVLMGIGMAGLGMVLMHDANHGAFSKNPKLNQFLGKSLYLLGGYPKNWIYQHNTLHHGFTNIEGHDEDIEPPAGLMRFSPHKPRKKIHAYQHIYAWFFYSLMTVSWIITKDFVRLKRYRDNKAPIFNRKSYGQMMIDLIISKVFYYAVFLALPIVLIPVAWYWVFVGFLLMHMVAGLILSTVFQTAHVMPDSEYPMPDESGNMENNWAVHQMLTTSDFSPRSRLLSWMIGGLNYQIEHHLFPNISHVHYKNIAPIVRETAEKHGIPYNVQPSFAKAVYNHAKMLKHLGRK